MKKLRMGEEYTSFNGTQVKTITTAVSLDTGRDLVIFVILRDDGELSKQIAMDEGSFIKKFCWPSI